MAAMGPNSLSSDGAIILDDDDEADAALDDDDYEDDDDDNLPDASGVANMAVPNNNVAPYVNKADIGR